MRIRKLLCTALAAVLMLVCAACGGDAEPTIAPAPTAETTAPTLPPVLGDGETSPTAEVIENPVENPITYFSMSLGEDYEHIRYLVAYEDFGQTYVEFVGDEKKVGTFGASFLHRLTEQAALADLAALNGIAQYTAGDPLGSMYVTYADGTYLSADFSGQLPEGFADAYALLEAWFAEQTADLPAYVPQPVITGEVDETLQGEMLAILQSSGIVELDMLMISEIPKDDYFLFTAGLSSGEPIVKAAQCTAMMMTTPYSFVIVSVREESQVEAVRQDFLKCLDWNKWVCVTPSDALIARKGNLVLCLMGADAIYDLTVSGIENSGWTEIETYPNPGE